MSLFSGAGGGIDPFSTMETQDFASPAQTFTPDVGGMGVLPSTPDTPGGWGGTGTGPAASAIASTGGPAQLGALTGGSSDESMTTNDRKKMMGAPGASIQGAV